MELETTARSLTSHGDLSSGMFGLSLDNEAHIISILRSTLYTNKELAVLREYTTNAWDAHVDAGIPQRPIKVVLPTVLDPTLVIRDYGRGMSEETVYGVYSQYGASTKRASNTTVGFLGIGSKSAFAYSDTFSITSFHGGVKCLYVAALDETNRGRITKLVEEPCGEETGIEVRIAVNPGDIPSFIREATELFQFYDPRPEINLELPERTYDRRQHGLIERPASTGEQDPSGVRWVALMGVVPYRLNFAKMAHDLQTLGLDGVVDTIGGVLFFNIGEVSVSASREELEYTPRTRAAVVERLRLLFHDLLGHVTQIVDDPNTSAWTKRLTTSEFFRSTGLTIPTKFQDWADEDSVTLYAAKHDGDGNAPAPAASFQMLGYLRKYKQAPFSSRMQGTIEVPVLPNTRLIIRDTTKSLIGYHLQPESDRVITVTEENLADFLRCVEQAGLGGIPIIRLSDLKHDKDREQQVLAAEKAGRRGPGSPKHVQRRFLLKDPPARGFRTSPPLSDNWDIVAHVPTRKDVFVILNHFEPAPCDDSAEIGRGFAKFYRLLNKDRCVFDTYGVKVPPIYGIKTTQKDPVDPDRVLGISYAKWRAAQLKRVLRKKTVVRDLQNYFWWCLLTYSRVLNSHEQPRRLLEGALKLLPATHAVVAFLDRATQQYEAFKALPESTQDACRYLANALYPEWARELPPPPETDAATHLAVLLTRYPLLAHEAQGPGLDLFRNPGRTDLVTPWVHYLQLIG